MSVRRGKTQTDYVRHEEEAELENIQDFLWGRTSSVSEAPELWFAPETYQGIVVDKEDRIKERQEKRNMERAYTSVCKTHHASYSGGYCGQRNTRKSCTNYRGRR